MLSKRFAFVNSIGALGTARPTVRPSLHFGNTPRRRGLCRGIQGLKIEDFKLGKIMNSYSPELVPPLASTLLNGLENVGDDFGFGFSADVAFAVKAHAHGAGLHVARADNEHGMDFGQFGLLNLAIDFVGTIIAFRSDHAGAEFLDDEFRVID